MITIVNISQVDVTWGTVIIQSNNSLPITNDGIVTGEHVLTFEQFSINTNLIEIENNIEIYDGAGEMFKDDAIEWIEGFYNNPMSEFDSSTGTGNMRKDTYDKNLNGIVDKSEAVTFNTGNVGATIYTLIGPGSTTMIDDIIGVNVNQGLAVISGRSKLTVKNDSGRDVDIVPGVSIYYGINGIGSIPSALPGIQHGTDAHFYVGMTAEQVHFNAGETKVIEMIVDIQKQDIHNPESDGNWLRTRSDWTEEINGGTY